MLDAADSTTRPLVSIIVLSFNQREFLRGCLASVRGQTYQPREVLVVDNASTDGSAGMVQEELPEVRLLVLRKNYGYAGGHNRGIRESRGAFVLLLNADVLLEPTYLEELVRVMDHDPKIGMVQGKLYQMGDRMQSAGGRRLDSTGIVIHRNRRTLLRGYGEVDRGQYDDQREVFAPDGAAPLYRRTMLEDIRYHEEYFDEAFFLYREEVDLGWRARWRGWQAVFAPRAMGWHVRRYVPGGRRDQPRWLRRIQFRNRYYLLLKNESWRGLARDAGPILWFEVRALVYTLCREPHYLLAYGEVLKGLVRLLAWRRAMMRKRRVSPQALGRWLRGDSP